MRSLILLGYMVAQSMVCLAGPTIPTKLEKSVQQTYPHAEHKVWYEIENGYRVDFDNGSIKCKIEYDQQGQMTKAFRYYGAESLPPLIAEKLYQKWEDRKVYGVTELSTPESIHYTIVLQDEKHWYTIESDGEGDLSQKAKMVKG